MSNMMPAALANAHFQQCREAHDFINTLVRPRIEQAFRAAPDPVLETFYGKLLRVTAWMQTLYRLNLPGDFQAVTAADRALFEIAIDVTLLHFDLSTTAAKLLAWEESAKLKVATDCTKYYAEQGVPLPEADHPWVRYIAEQSSRIQNLRQQHWNTPNHPGQRWTGRSLRDDAIAATRFFQEGDFEGFHRTRYPYLCWNTHGSGFAGIRGITSDMFPGLAAMAFNESTRFAIIAAEIILRQYGLWDAATAVEFDEHRIHRVVTVYATISGIPPEIVRIIAEG